MAGSTTTHHAISHALHESQIQTVAMLRSFIATKKPEHSDVFLRVIEDFSCSLKLPRPAPRLKKDPSDYNLFIRDRIKEYKKINPSYNGHDLMRLATAAWKSFNGKKI